MTFNISCSPHSNKTKSPLSKDEEYILVILDTLKNDYYWQMIPIDMMGRIPTLEERMNIPPFRMERDKYLKEIDSLLNNNLSEQFLLNLLNNDYIYHKNKVPQIDLYKLVNKLLAFQSDNAYRGLYSYFKDNYYNKEIPFCISYIGIKLIEHNRYKKEIRNNVIENNFESGKTDAFLHRFDKETDILILDKTVRYIKDCIEKDPYSAYLAKDILVYYYNTEEYDVLEKENVKKLIAEMNRCRSGKEFEKARNNYWRTCTEYALQYYENHRGK